MIGMYYTSFARVKVKVCERELTVASRTDYFIILLDTVTVFLPLRETLRRFARQPLTDAPSNYVSATNTTAGMTLSTILIRFSALIVCGGHEGKPRGRLTS